MRYRYYLKAPWQRDRQEVTREQFIEAERAAGFYPKDSRDKLATGGFGSSHGTQGTIVPLI